MAIGALLSILGPILSGALKRNRQTADGSGLRDMGTGFQIYSPGDPGAKMRATLGGAAEGALGAYMGKQARVKQIQRKADAKTEAAEKLREERRFEAARLKDQRAFDAEMKAQNRQFDIEDSNVTDMRRLYDALREEKNRDRRHKDDLELRREVRGARKASAAEVEKRRVESAAVRQANSDRTYGREVAKDRAAESRRVDEAARRPTAAQAERSRRLTASLQEIPIRLQNQVAAQVERDVEARKLRVEMSDVEEEDYRDKRLLYWARKAHAGPAPSGTGGVAPSSLYPRR